MFLRTLCLFREIYFGAEGGSGLQINLLAPRPKFTLFICAEGGGKNYFLSGRTRSKNAPTFLDNLI